LGFVLLALALVFGLAVTGCDTGGGDDPPPPPPPGGDPNLDDLYDAGWEVDGNPFTYTTSSITFDDNFTYGTSWQKKIPWASLLNTAIKVNDAYELEIAFTVNRALDNKLQWVLVNDDASVSYWQELSAWKPVINGQDKDFDEENGTAPIFTTTDNVSYKGRTFATTAAPASQAKLAFDTEAADASGGAPVLTITTFKITKLKWVGSEEGGTPKTVELGDFNVSNGGTQKGWHSSNMSDESILSTVDIADFIAAKYLVLELNAVPTGGMQIIWQGDSDDYGWNQEDILSNLGAADASKGTSFEGTTLKIELSKALKNYSVYITNTKVKILIAYYSPDIAGLGVTKAYLSE